MKERTERKTILLTEEELDQFEDAAKVDGLPITSWLRNLGARRVQEQKVLTNATTTYTPDEIVRLS